MIKTVLTIALASSILFSYEMDYTKESACVVRNIKVYKEPKWVSKIELNNGKKLFFSSPKSMIEFYHRPGKWFDIGVKSEEDFKDIIVTDYATMKLINAKGAFYVYGSNETSPAGDDLPAFATFAEAENFSKAHNGKRIMHFRDISDALIRLLNGRI
ncbi:MAG: nitrous oxide reductase accessory protein NosL [Campylobacterota bacterium]|nr:nitrous oxide reductase accessory protein NosL [Campylobacterota bacterium]